MIPRLKTSEDGEHFCIKVSQNTNKIGHVSIIKLFKRTVAALN